MVTTELSAPLNAAVPFASPGVSSQIFHFWSHVKVVIPCELGRELPATSMFQLG